MARAAHRIARPVRVKVGQRVGFSVAGRVLSAEVIEDRGDLGARGQQVVRLSVEDPTTPTQHFEVEVPVDWLAEPPLRARR